MKIIDISNPQRVNRTPNKSHLFFSNENLKQNGFLVKSAELRFYKFESDSLISIFVDTDKGSIETTYEEGKFDVEYFDKSVKFVVEHLGISVLILRSIIELKNELDKHNR